MLSAKARGAILLTGGIVTSLLLPAAPLTPPIASYEIACRLEPEKRTIEGTEVLTWTNRTSRAAQTLQFHLYLNAFRNTLSTFWRESRGRHRDNPLPEDWGWIEIKRMTLSDGTDLLPSLRYLAPDDGNAHDRTVAEVLLPRSVEPAETLSVSIDFVSRLPRVSARTGYKGDFFFVAQWFPKIGVLEERGWNCHQFHATSEFFADFGDYDVSIDVPSRYRGKVGATGERVEERNAAGDRVVYRFRQQSVHDFAWTADPSYRVLRDRFREPGIADVELTLLLQPEHGRQASRHFEAVKAALAGYGRVLGPYPYRTLTLVDPPWGARGAGGMEYPTLITCGTWLAAPRSVQSPESVTIHEFGHQYFYGLLASNEFEEPFLDEGFNTYMTARVLQARYGPNRPVLSVFGYRVPLGLEMHHPVDGNRRYFAVATEDLLAIPAWKFRNREVYGAHVYSKTALMLATLERLIGTARMDRALRLYADRWRFRHPTSADWIRCLNDSTGEDWTWFFQRVFSSGTVDYGIEEATTAPSKAPRGRFDEEKPPQNLARPAGYDSLVTVRRLGEVALPVEILLRFEGNRTWRGAWNGEARWKRLRIERGPRLIEATVDPDAKLLLDTDRTNNGLRPEADPRAASRWTARAVFWVQNLLDFATVAW
jgi:Peptidase family M1 domain